MNELVQKLFADGIVSKEGVKTYLKAKNDDLKLFTKIQEYCGSIRKNTANLALIQTWRDWKFNDEMILEAAKRSATSANPIPYINKILSDWKQAEVFNITDIPTHGSSSTAFSGNSSTTNKGYVNPTIVDVNAKADRERYYALLREKAQTRAEKFLAKANANARFKEIAAELSKMELALAKAEVFEQTNLPALKEQKRNLLAERKQILTGMGIDETQLLPQFTCKKCSDTGFLPSGTACNCYNPQ